MLSVFPSVDVTRPELERGSLWFEVELDVKSRGDVFVGYRYFDRLDPRIVGSVDQLKINATGDAFERTTRRLDIGDGQIPGMPRNIETLTLGGGPDGRLLVGAVGAECDELAMMPFPGESFVWFAEWEHERGNRSVLPFEGITIEHDVCSSWPPSNLDQIPVPLMGRATILNAQNMPMLLFKVAGGSGPGMAQEMYWTSVSEWFSGALERYIGAPLSSFDALVQSQIVPLGEGPLVMAQSNEMGGWTVWNPYEGGSVSRIFPGSDRIDVVPDRGSETDFILAAAQGSQVTLSQLTCKIYEEGMDSNGERCSPPNFPTTIEIGAQVLDAKLVSIYDAGSQSPTVVLVTAEASGTGDLVRARIVRLNTGEQVCLGASETLTLDAPNGIQGIINDLQVSSRTPSGTSTLCEDVIVAVSQGDVTKPETGGVDMIWSGGFRMCQ